jgi:hypothetical protein
VNNETLPRRIDVDEEVYGALRANAEPFIDTPNSVLRRLLGLDAASTSTAGASQAPPRPMVPRSAPKAGPKARKAKSSKPRAAAGTLLPEKEYELPLLQALVDAGGSAPSKQLIERVGELIGDRLTEQDCESLSSGGVRWQSRIQFVRLRLIERGLMQKDTPRGIWAITDSGEELVTGSTGDQRGGRNNHECC